MGPDFGTAHAHPRHEFTQDCNPCRALLNIAWTWQEAGEGGGLSVGNRSNGPKAASWECPDLKQATQCQLVRA